MEKVTICIAGAGVVGLAIARSLAQLQESVLVLDKEPSFGQGISSRNSEVIHAGIYYPKDSLKAELCVRGKHMLYEFCEKSGVGYRRCGKLIVATCAEEEAILEDFRSKGVANGVDDLEFWSAKKLGEEEPFIQASKAVFSPSTGIVSAYELMQALLAQAEANGTLLALNSRVKEVEPDSDGFKIFVDLDGGEEFVLNSRIFINAAGLGAQQISQSIRSLDPLLTPPLILCKGNYFSLQAKSPFKHLIYPVPDPSGAGLGIHATLDLGGQTRFGPDVEYVDLEEYSVNSERIQSYYKAVRRYYPGLADDALVPAYCGIRPKTTAPGEPVQDFMILGPDECQMPGLIQLFGIESPGLTSSLAIAEKIRDMVKNIL